MTESIEQKLDRIRARVFENILSGRTLPGVVFCRRDSDGQPPARTGRIMATLIVQGRGSAGSCACGRGQCLIGAPANAAGAAPEKPFLALSLPLKPETLAELAREAQLPVPKTRSKALACVCDADLRLVDAFARLVSLTGRPEEIPFVFPLLEREIHYRLLISPAGEEILSLGCVAGGRESFPGSRRPRAFALSGPLRPRRPPDRCRDSAGASGM